MKRLKMSDEKNVGVKQKKKKDHNRWMEHKNPLAFKGIFGGIEPKQVICNGLLLW